MAILAAGATAPGFDLADVQGTRVTLESVLAGGQALLTFFSLDCRACDLSYLFWDRMAEAYAATGCPVLTICLEGAEAAATFYDRSGVSFTVLSDPGNTTARAYGIECTPALFLVDSSSRLASSHDAFDREALNGLSAEIAARLGVSRVMLSEGEAPAFSPGCVAHL